MYSAYYEVYLNGTGLHMLDPAIVITDVLEGLPQMDVQSVMLAGSPGEYCTRQMRKSISVEVKLRIVTADYARRKEIWRRINAWAGHGGLLALSDRQGQQLHVRLAAPLALPSTLNWAGELSMSFTSSGLPYWQEDTPAMVRTTAASGAVNLYPRGDVDTQLEVTAINQSPAPLTRLRIDVGGHFIALEGLSIAQNASLRLYYDSQHILQLPLASRTEDSSDELPLSACADNRIAFSADQPAAFTFSARGCFL